MNRRLRLVQIFFTAILLSGCADIAKQAVSDAIVKGIPRALAQAALVETLTHEIGAPKQSIIVETQLKTDRLESINSIALLTIPDPPYYFFSEGGTGTYSYLFYPITDLAERSAYGEDTVEYGDFSFGRSSQAFLKQFLEENNYEVFEHTVNRENVFGLVDDYESLDITGIDAYLDVAPVEIGYKEKKFSTSSESRPYVLVVARLVTAHTNEIIYSGSILYGWDTDLSAAGVKIKSPEDHEYSTKEDLKANKEQAIIRLERGIEAVSLNIAKKISKGKFNSVMRSPIEDVLEDSDKHEQPALSVDVSGTYSSTITGFNAQNILGTNPVVKLTQKGNKVSGTYGTTGGDINGEIEDGRIKFKYRESGGGSGRGEWTVEPDSGELIGKWDSTTWTGSGKWNLKRIE